MAIRAIFLTVISPTILGAGYGIYHGVKNNGFDMEDPSPAVTYYAGRGAMTGAIYIPKLIMTECDRVFQEHPYTGTKK